MAEHVRRGTPRSKTGANRRLLNYPRAGVAGWTRWLPSLRLVGLVALVGFVAVIAAFSIGYAMTGIPSPNAAAAGQTSNVYYADGKTQIGSFKVENRKSVGIDKISTDMQHAAIAAEDKTFYENRGISLKGLSRAVWGVATDNYSGGGSTITQQYVKNYYLTDEHSITRKVKEMFIALKIDQEQSKDEILANYLNTVFLGRRSYGIEVASQAYFDKPASELDRSQSALLAAMIQQPSLADPAEEPEKYEGRFRYVLNGMAELGYISQAEADSTQLPKVNAVKKENQYKGQAGYLMDAVRSELKDSGHLTDDQIDRGGLNVTTTFDKDKVKDAQKAVKKLPKLKKGMRVGLVSINPKTGGIEALYGGPDYYKRMQNQSTRDRAQAGSTFKPFALTAAFENGYRLNDTFVGSSTTFRNDGTPWHVSNYGGSSYGRVSLLEATEKSINTAYAQLNVNMGPKKTQEAAIRAGVPKDTPGLDSNASNVLGTASPTTKDMASAFATFAAGGVYRAPHMVEEAKDSNAKSIYKPDTEGERRFDKAVAAETTYALRHVVTSGSGTYAQNLGRPAAGKTGTSQNNVSAWFDGYTPQLATSVSMFREKVVEKDGKKIVTNIPIGAYGGRGAVTGGSFPVQVWTDYSKAALKGTKVESFPKRGELPEVDKPDDESGAGQGRASSEDTSDDEPRRTHRYRSDDSQKKGSSSKKSSAPKKTKDADEDKKKSDDSEDKKDDSDDSKKDDGGSDDGGSDDGGGKDDGGKDDDGGAVSPKPKPSKKKDSGGDSKGDSKTEKKASGEAARPEDD
ncbi:penicillin-binding protein [Brevibacterium sp. 5221]|uniref:Penicillin-binding protein n=1 Tax=Brevibacterium rongguiense TaxID=2695267 RepID=A0A6N9HAW0_9MICO|nr:transglycosylase domain-containing protein [Brevibacterium rongguiense]MYM20871.1 penicillin-binding protein [Brevibacterium rongguiense]